MLKEKLIAKFQPEEDLKIRTLYAGRRKLTVLFLDGMSGGDRIAETVMQPLLLLKTKIRSMESLKRCFLYTAEAKVKTDVEELAADLLNGHSVLFAEGFGEEAIDLDTRLMPERAVAEPPTGGVNKGPREGFVENIKTNLSLLRRRLKTENFRMRTLNIGRYTSTKVAVCYLNGIADQRIVKQVMRSLKRIDIDGVIDSSYLANFLDGKETTLFKLVGTTEKPDIAAAKMLEGRVCIVADGSPIVLTVPYLFVEDLQAPDDYYDTPVTATVARLLRALAVIASVLLPGLFVSLQMYNYQIIPTKFLITIMNATQGLPFTPIIEMVIVLILFDILREASARMPQFAGVSLSIVGAIVLGDAAVKAGLLGAPSVMIGALSGIGLYTLPDNTLIMSLLRLVCTVLGGLMGVYGILIASLFLISFVVSLNRYGSPYLAPFTPSLPRDKEDAVFKRRLAKLTRRPDSVHHENDTRLNYDDEN